MDLTKISSRELCVIFDWQHVALVRTTRTQGVNMVQFTHQSTTRLYLLFHKSPINGTVDALSTPDPCKHSYHDPSFSVTEIVTQ